MAVKAVCGGIRALKPRVVVEYPVAGEVFGVLREVAEAEVIPFSGRSLLEAVSDAEGFMGFARIDEGFLCRAPRLRILAYYGVGYQDRFDVEACTRKGVYVTFTPGALSGAVAELTMGLILCCARQIPLADAYVRSGRWQSGEKWTLGVGLEGKTLGVLGLGRIGNRSIDPKAFATIVMSRMSTFPSPLRSVANGPAVS